MDYIMEDEAAICRCSMGKMQCTRVSGNIKEHEFLRYVHRITHTKPDMLAEIIFLILLVDDKVNPLFSPP